MSLPSPNLDDRNFHDLVLEAQARIAQSCPSWTDRTPHDPGMVLLELFAHLTDVMIYRLNRVPEKAYVEFLRLIGVKLQPPAAATARLVFSLEKPLTRVVEIPRGTKVTPERPDSSTAPVIFATDSGVKIEAGQTSVEVLAHHAEQREEVLGEGTGAAGLSFRLKWPPVVARTGDELDLVLGVEVKPGELDGRAPAREADKKAFRIWREVESFTVPGPDAFVYVADRMTGLITFAPAAQLTLPTGALAPAPSALAAVPELGREIRAWYRYGGGPSGNVAANTLTVLKSELPEKVKVTNPQPAVGGRAAESLENALIRGPEEIHSLRRAVTARDFEVLALKSSAAIARAKAFTQAQLWRHAPAGTVEVLLVPDLPPAVRGAEDQGVNPSVLRAHQTEDARKRIQAELDERRPLGTNCLVNWARYKAVAVRSRVVAHRAEDPAAIRTRVLAQLYRSINPLPHAEGIVDTREAGGGERLGGGWRFGRAIRASNVYDVLLSEPGVAHVEAVRLMVEEVPSAVKALAADLFQPSTWYAGSGETLFRSVNDADGWEPAGVFPKEDVDCVEAHPERPGLIAVAARLAQDPDHSRLHLSIDCGETWEAATHTLDAIEDLAWVLRDGLPVLFIATRVGLFELALQPGAKPLPVVVDAADQDLGLWAVASSVDFSGVWRVVAAGMQNRGVFASEVGGRKGSFKPVGLGGEDVRMLEIQRDGPRTFLWAGFAAASGADAGKGCASLEVTTSINAANWKPWNKNWDGGSCLALSFSDSTVYAGTHRNGVLWVDSNKDGANWRRPDVGSGLPLREQERLFYPVQALAAKPQGGLLLAGGPGGVVRSTNAESYKPCSQKEYAESEKVTLPPTWLFCSGKHEIEVVQEDATSGD